MQEFIDQMFFMAKVHREDGDPTVEADAAAYTWAAIDATIYQDAEYGLRTWTMKRLESLPPGTFDDDTLLEIRGTARDILLSNESGGHL